MTTGNGQVSTAAASSGPVDNSENLAFKRGFLRRMSARSCALLAFICLASAASAAVLGPQDLLVVDLLYNLVRVDPISGEQTLIASGGNLFFPIGIALADDLDVFVLDFLSDNTGGIIRIDPVTGAQTVISSGELLLGTGLAVDAQGDLWVATSAGIVRVDPVTGVQTVISVANTSAIATDAEGNIWAAGPTGVIRVDPGTGAQTVVSSAALVAAFGLEVGPAGDIWVADAGTGIIRVDPETGASTVVSPGMAFWDIAFDEMGDLLAARAVAGVFRVDPETGTSILLAYQGYLGLSTAITIVPGNLPDADGDGLPDGLDNCPTVPNPSQADTDGNQVGDACNEAEDPDGDEIANPLDNCPGTFNPGQENSDGDSVGDACDPFPNEPDNALAQCSVDLASCEATLAQSESDLAQCDLDLVQALADLAAAEDMVRELGGTPATPPPNGVKGCGLGFELALFLAPLMWLRARRKPARR